MEYNDIFNDIPQSYFDYILREKRGKMNLEHFINSGYNEWMSVLDLTSIKLTEDEVIKFGYIYRSKFFPKKSQKGEIVTMTFDLTLANGGGGLPASLYNVEPLSDTNRTPIGFDTSMFSSLMCNGNDLLDSAKKKFEVINTKDSVQNSINYITEEIGSLTVKVSRPLTENSYYALVINFPEQNGVYISYARCTEENMSYDFAKIDDTTYDCTFTSYLNGAIEYGGQVSIIFFDTINGLPEDFVDYDEFTDLELFNSNINNIINTTLKCQTQGQLYFPSSEGIYVVEGELKEGVTSIERGVFNICPNLTSIIFADDSQLTSIGGGAFQNCQNLTSIKIPSGVTSIGDSAFQECNSLTSIEIPSGVTSIGENAFSSCSSLSSIEIPSGITSIGVHTFSRCSGLTSIEIPKGVTSIEDWAFYRCSGLTSVIFADDSQLTSIGESAFQNCQNLTSIKIPSGVTSIGKSAFSACSSLPSIEIPSGVTSIGGHAFSSCSSLSSIEIPSGVTLIEDYTFNGCSSLTSIEIPSGVTSIGECAFGGCSSLTSIEIPSGVTSIGEMAFINCSSLSSIEIPSSVTSIGDSAFQSCYYLTSIEIPSGVTSIGEGAFNYCSNLTSITCHAITAPSVQSYTFYNVALNGTLYYPKGSDYSSWLSSNSYYLGYRGWQGIEI